MRRLRENSRGLSEIVGTLMLVLIVIGAAVAFAAFVATYEKQLLTQEAVNHDRALESIRVLTVTPVPQSGTPTLAGSISFLVESETVNPSNISAISIDGIPVAIFCAAPGTGTCTPTNPIPGYQLNPFAQATIGIDLIPGTGIPIGSSVSLTSDLEISLYTVLGNVFNSIYLPPTAIATVSLIPVESGNSLSYIPALDGSESTQPGTNQTIVAWLWTVTSTDDSNFEPMGACSGLFSGEEVELGSSPCEFTADDTYSITLQVANDVGLIGLEALQYSFEPSS